MKAAARTVRSDPVPAAKAVEPATPRLESRPVVIQRKCACGGGGESCGCEDEKKVQRKARGKARVDAVPAEVERTLSTPGTPLADRVREEMERRFGHDFGAVRLHVDDVSARAVNARAFTVGTHVVFDGPASAAEPRLLAHELTHVVQQHSGTFRAERTISDPHDAHEREADAVAERVTGGGEAGRVAPAPPQVARDAGPRSEEPQPESRAAEGPASAGAAPSAPSSPSAPPAAGAEAEAAPARIVDDDVDDVGAGQMRKSEFLDQLSVAACSAADEELTRVGRSTEGCPYVERALTYYRRQPAHRVERAIRIYASGATRVATARDYIPLVSARIGQGVARWASTGEISGIPPELAAQMPAMGLPQMIGAGLRAIGSAIGSAFSAIGRLFGKSSSGAAVPVVDAGASNATRLSGAPLDGGVRTRMERAFGNSFAGVRVHTGAGAAGVATRLGARAYTIGSDIAFAGGEYQPGTLVGDALIAHELAHVVQQRGAVTTATGNDAAYEEDADQAAVGAMARAWGGARGRLRDLGKKAGPRMRSGLRLSRCSGSRAAAPGPATPVATPAVAEGPGADVCPESPLAPGVAATEEGARDPTIDEFGATSRDPATVGFGARLVDDQWHFCLNRLVVHVKSAVQPEGYRVAVNSADDAVVAADTWGPIARDLRPTSTGSAFGTCQGERIEEPRIRGYSRRRTYWKRELVVRHEAFHATDWMSFYRPQLVTAEQTVLAHRLPAAEAASAEAAVRHERTTLRDTMNASYMTACRAYVPEKETRAYADGRPEYLALVDAIRARARAAGWNYPTAEIEAP